MTENNRRIVSITLALPGMVGPAWKSEPPRDVVVDVLTNLLHWYGAAIGNTVTEDQLADLCRVAHDHYDVELEEEKCQTQHP